MSTETVTPVFRLATPDDIDLLNQLEQNEQEYPWSSNMIAEHVSSSRYRVGILEKDAVIIAYFSVLAVAGEYSLLNLLVAREYRGQGFGWQLLRNMLDLARGEADTVFLEVRAGNTRAIALYQAAGFVETDLRKAYYPAPDGREDAIVMALSL